MSTSGEFRVLREATPVLLYVRGQEPAEVVWAGSFEGARRHYEQALAKNEPLLRFDDAVFCLRDPVTQELIVLGMTPASAPGDGDDDDDPDDGEPLVERPTKPPRALDLPRRA